MQVFTIRNGFKRNKNVICACLPYIMLLASTASLPTHAADYDTGELIADQKSKSQLTSGDVDTVDPRDGNLSIKHRDLLLPGNGGLDIEVWRTYSMAAASSNLSATHNFSYRWAALGPGWSLGVAPLLYSHSPYNARMNPNGSFTVYHQKTGLARLCDGTLDTNSPQHLNYLELPNGDKQQFYHVQNGLDKSKDGWKLTCESGLVKATSPNGLIYDFGNFSERRVGRFAMNTDETDPTTGEAEIPVPVQTVNYLPAKSERDLSGNTLTYEYTNFGTPLPVPTTPRTGNSPDSGLAVSVATIEKPSTLLSRVTSSDGRSVTFSYDATSGRLASMSDNAGRVWSYSYLIPDNLNSRSLSKVTLPTGLSWEYGYAPGTFLNRASSFVIKPLNTDTITSRKLVSLKYPQGGITSYKYDFYNLSVQLTPGGGARSARERVVKRELSNGASWSYSYTRGENGQYDTTQVNGPDGIETYSHIGYGYNIRRASGLPQNATQYQNTLWQVGQPTKKSDASGNTIVYTWDKRTLSDLRTYANELGTVWDEKVWAAMLQSKVETRNGATYTTRYSNYDEYGNAGTKVETGPNGGTRTTTYTYFNDPAKWIIGKVKSEVSAAGSISRTFDANGKVQTETRDGVSTSFTYDTQGNLASKTLPGNRVYTYSNYKRGTPQMEVQPEGITITRVVDDAGNITSETNGEGKITLYTYDGLGRITSIKPPLGNTQTFTYTPTSESTTRGDLVVSTQYDQFGRVVSITRGGITTRYEHDALGRRTFVSAPGATTGTRYQYDTLGRVTRVTNADNSYQIIAYGAATRTVTDERGKVTSETYRGYGNPDQLQLMAISAPEPSANVTLTRDAADRITSVKQGTFTRTYGYNANGYLTSVANPETGNTVYGRDIAGNMTSKQVGASGVTSYTYDGQNRVKTVTYPGTTPAVTNTYDKTGKLVASTSTGGNRAMAYDAAGNLIQQSLTLDGKTFIAKYGYNANDQLASITYPQSASVVNYTPDALGRPTTVSGYVSKVTYWPSGMINQITYANGTTTTYTQTPRLWPATFATAKTGGATYLNSAYTYDGTGNLATIADSVDISFNRTLGYDGINRLTSAAGFWGAGSISYDGVGNLLKQTYGTTSLNYAYDTQNRLASVSGQRTGSFTYDAYGNIASSAGTTYTYDGVPNLVCINCAVAASKVAYQYDAINQRSSVTKGGRKVYEMHDADGKQLIELDGTTLTEYIYLGDKRIADRVSP